MNSSRRKRRPRFVVAELGRSSSVPSLPGDRDLFEGLEKTPLQAISRTFDIVNHADTTISNRRVLSSPTIIVPGPPREWLGREAGFKVSRDEGFHFVDQNAFRFPNAPLLPLFAAVDTLASSGSFSWRDVDFVTDRNNLRKLLWWIGGAMDGQPLDDFRIDLQLAGKKTVLMSRWEKRDREGNTWRCFFNFERASTRNVKGCQDGTGHHRILRYDLNGLNMVVHFEVDTFVPGCSTTSSPKRDHVDHLVTQLSGDSFTSKGLTTPLESRFGVKIRHAGTPVPHEALVEFETRSEKTLELNRYESRLEGQLSSAFPVADSPSLPGYSSVWNVPSHHS
ncbi:hypothetical protein FISHEDRAFT_55981 [Fistulina hepatica ATCC 64428]|uniref:Uncharacterized protein n=1 Tax=Fistulina hepatica ATCC 64428 TaxID=1128425 RepID=A0A0D7AME3_9AGAR|nr:hypothetical protein FISHEDRAFT_55981 [Fistulina hepatica ATCC 64428]